MEIWKDIKGYEGLYQVSNLGNVRSVKRNCNQRYGLREVKERILKTGKTKKGYLIVVLSKEQTTKSHAVHTLVANAFIPNVNNYPQINHIDENKENNNVNNLEWCTNKYNCNYGTRTIRQKQKVSKPVLQYDLKGNFIKKWGSISEAAKNLKMCITCISYNCNGKRKTAGGYIWKYEGALQC